jgi:hypothetical protein
MARFEPEAAVFEVPKTEGAVEVSNGSGEQLKFILI